MVDEKRNTKEQIVLFRYWQDKIVSGNLKVASLTSMASQLPLFMSRFQRLVDQFYDDIKFDPERIGIKGNGTKIRWKIFYDNQDLLGFPSAGLFSPNRCIKDIQVDSGWFTSAHTGYFKTHDVITGVAELISSNMA
jgi:hypothetical protein